MENENNPTLSQAIRMAEVMATHYPAIDIANGECFTDLKGRDRDASKVITDLIKKAYTEGRTRGRADANPIT